MYFNNYFNTSSYDFNLDDCSKNFLNLLSIFKTEVEKINARFYVLVFPGNKNLDFFNNIVNQKKDYFNYYFLDKNLIGGSVINNKKINFKNDAHWNEYGNLYFAYNLSEIFNKIKIISKKINLDNKIKKIDNFYKKYK